MDEDSLNMDIRKFLKKVGIASQREIEREIYQAKEKGKIQIGDEIDLEMSLKMKQLDKTHIIQGKIKIY